MCVIHVLMVSVGRSGVVAWQAGVLLEFLEWKITHKIVRGIIKKAGGYNCNKSSFIAVSLFLMALCSQFKN